MKSTYANQYRDLWTRHWWWQARRRFILGKIEDIARRHSIQTILDIGCGDGLFMQDLSRFGTVHGVEPDRRLLSPDNPYRDQIEVISFGKEYRPRGAYDLIVMLDVLEHIEDDLGALGALKRSLAPGGFALLTVPALPFLWSMHDEANSHFRRYSRESLKAVLEAADLGILRCDYYFGWTVLPLVLRRVLTSFRTKRDGVAGEYRVGIPARPVNGCLRLLSVAEQAISTRKGLPIGSSLFALVQNPPMRSGA